MASVWLQRAKVATTKIFKSTSSYFLDLALWGQSIQIHTPCPHQSYHVLLDLNADPGEERWLSKLYDVWDCSDCSGLGWNQSKCVWESSGWRWGLLNGLLEIGNLVIVWFGTMIESPCWLTAMEIKLLASAVKNNAPFATGVPDSRNAQRLLELKLRFARQISQHGVSATLPGWRKDSEQNKVCWVCILLELPIPVVLGHF